MARLGTALERSHDAPSGRPRSAPGRRLAGALERRDATGPPESWRAAARRAASPLGERIVGALERQLARAVERRIGGGSSDREPGRLEQRLVAAIERRMAGGRPAPGGERDLGPLGRSLQRRPRARAVARRQTTLRALVVGIFARGIVRSLALLIRILGRGLISSPMRRFARFLGRRAMRARPSNQASFLALLLAAIALLFRRLTASTESRRAAAMLGLRLLRTLIPLLARLAGRLLRRARPVLEQAARRAAAARREAG